MNSIFANNYRYVPTGHCLDDIVRISQHKYIKFERTKDISLRKLVLQNNFDAAVHDLRWKYHDLKPVKEIERELEIARRKDTKSTSAIKRKQNSILVAKPNIDGNEVSSND